jgi:hypothetical protein
MKQKDMAMIIVVAAISVVFSIILSNVVLSGVSAKEQQAETVEPISAAFQQPDTRYFNANSIDPTQIIKIGDGSNQSPFEDSAQ